MVFLKNLVSTRLILICFLLAFSSASNALGLHLEGSLEGGGDNMLTTSGGQDLNLGGGMQFSFGLTHEFGRRAGSSMILSLGQLSDSINVSNGNGDYQADVFEGSYLLHAGAHRFGVGIVQHLNPVYNDAVAGFPPTDIVFENSTGAILRYGYQISSFLQFGVKYTVMEYISGTDDYDAGSIGFYLSSGS